jgi:hypothetical protein
MGLVIALLSYEEAKIFRLAPRKRPGRGAGRVHQRRHGPQTDAVSLGLALTSREQAGAAP